MTKVAERLLEWIAAKRVSKGKTAQMMHVRPGWVYDVLRGRGISAKTALRLERLTGVPAIEWLTLNAEDRLKEARGRQTV